MPIDSPSAESPPKLQVKSLVSPYGGPFSLFVSQGECVSVVGRSGSGKSVLLRLIADLDPHEGDVLLNGASRNAVPAPQWRQQVVYQAAEPAWWAATAAAHLASPHTSAVQPMLLQLGLDPSMLGIDITRLSTGERQRLALVRSLAVAPKVLLLDEPTASLDQASTAAVEALLASRMRDGLSVVFVTHSREQAERIGHRHFEVRDRALHPL
jgi:ABC-type iron transport system FetAB ATPase subunit